ncbi:MAG TPA: membrane protein insertion efficiency factor YidD [Ramlibacter sp.]|uniref:membrane protein insertion efficiency factor YidD n=1 Tax=Ramlibacter sp. TaxID=1917967 RepID=UPI002BB0EF99|nr:membrane protein insertion efficiency factor YidD [Ramlibacter sp.]HVZ46934.1 membrane protein insertion efficiency factor YidD [Ramlibacter sp.]
MIRRFLIQLIKAYRLLLSPVIGNACRFRPTCSQYGIEALQRHGALAGTYLTAARIVRCNPLCKGGQDPVPQMFSFLAHKNNP